MSGGGGMCNAGCDGGSRCLSRGDTLKSSSLLIKTSIFY